MFKLSCFFHSNCYDGWHIFSCFIVVILSCAALVCFGALIFWFIDCAIHTSFCNSLSMENSQKVRELERRVFDLEKSLKEESV